LKRKTERNILKLSIVFVVVLVLGAIGHVREQNARKTAEAESRRNYEVVSVEIMSKAKKMATANATFDNSLIPLSATGIQFAVYEDIVPVVPKRWVFPLEQLYLAQMIVGEAGGEPLRGQYMVAYVAWARAHDNDPVMWGSSDLRTLICNGEFNGAEDFCTLAKKGVMPPAPEWAMKIAHAVLSGDWQVPKEFADKRFFYNPTESSPGGRVYFAVHTIHHLRLYNHVFAAPKPKARVLVAKNKHHKLQLAAK
jgi:hypothetical protein